MSFRPSNNCVFILGAGATVHLGYPLMRQFMNRARRRYVQLQTAQSTTRAPFLIEQYHRMFAFHERCSSTSGVFDRTWDNIEELYTQADLLRQVGCHRDSLLEAEKTCHSIAWSIWDIYRPRWAESGTLLPITDTLVGPLAENLRPVIITTNYDTTAELALLDKGSHFYPGFERRQEFSRENWSIYKDHTNSQPLVLPQDGLPIIKLHGSSNWFRCAPYTVSVGTLVGSTAEATDNSKALVGSMSFDPEMIRSRLTEHPHDKPSPDTVLIPAIVPPMLGKTSSNPAISDQWEAAISMLAEARQIWVLGYSFPTTDSFMVRLLIEGITKNRDLEFFGIFDSADESQWEARIASLFAPSFRNANFRYTSVHARAFYGAVRANHMRGVQTPFADPFAFCDSLKAQ